MILYKCAYFLRIRFIVKQNKIVCYNNTYDTLFQGVMAAIPLAFVLPAAIYIKISDDSWKQKVIYNKLLRAVICIDVQVYSIIATILNFMLLPNITK